MKRLWPEGSCSRRLECCSIGLHHGTGGILHRCEGHTALLHVRPPNVAHSPGDTLYEHARTVVSWCAGSSRPVHWLYPHRPYTIVDATIIGAPGSSKNQQKARDDCGVKRLDEQLSHVPTGSGVVMMPFSNPLPDPL